MSHQAQVKTSIVIKNKEAFQEALQLLLKLYGGEIVEGTSEMKGYGGQRWRAKGTILRGLKIAAYHTDVDISVDSEGNVHLNGDANGIQNIEKEVKRAYEMIVRKKALHKMNIRTKLQVNPSTLEYVLVGEG